MGEQTFAHFQQSIINVMEKRPALRPEKGRAKCNHRDNDDPPSQNEVAPTCVEDAAKQDAQSVDDASTHQGKLILDATFAEQAIRFPTDLSLLNESRQISEQIIDLLHSLSGAKTKSRTNCQTALNLVYALIAYLQKNETTPEFVKEARDSLWAANAQSHGESRFVCLMDALNKLSPPERFKISGLSLIFKFILILETLDN